MCSYKAIIHHEDGQYWAEFPAFPGCYSCAETLEKLKAGLPDALRFHIQGLNDADCEKYCAMRI